MANLTPNTDLLRRLGAFEKALELYPDHPDPEGALASVVFSGFVWRDNEQRRQADECIRALVQKAGR